MTGQNAAALATSLTLVLVAVVVSRWQRLDTERTIVWATVRAIVQLLGVGAVLVVLLRPGTSIWWSWAWVAGMIGFAAVTMRRRAPEVPNLLALGLASYAIAATVTLGIVFGLRIFPLEPRALVPVAGMMVGNSMKATIVAARRVVEELRDLRMEVEARLALGMPSSAAAAPNVRSAIRTALIPQIETTKAVGLVFLPGAMTGLILAGVSPIDAVVIQAAIMFLILGSVALTTSITALGVSARLFTPDHRLRRIERPSA